MKQRKAQAALEFLTTYGWALLAIIVAIGALTYFGGNNVENSLPETCTFGGDFTCSTFAVAEDGRVGLTFQNNLDRRIIVTEIECIDPAGNKNNVDIYDTRVPPGTEIILYCGTATGTFSGRDKWQVKVYYSYDETGALSRTTTAELLASPIPVGLGVIESYESDGVGETGTCSFFAYETAQGVCDGSNAYSKDGVNFYADSSCTTKSCVCEPQAGCDTMCGVSTGYSIDGNKCYPDSSCGQNYCDGSWSPIEIGLCQSTQHCGYDQYGVAITGSYSVWTQNGGATCFVEDTAGGYRECKASCEAFFGVCDGGDVCSPLGLNTVYSQNSGLTCYLGNPNCGTSQSNLCTSTCVDYSSSYSGADYCPTAYSTNGGVTFWDSSSSCQDKTYPCKITQSTSYSVAGGGGLTRLFGVYLDLNHAGPGGSSSLPFFTVYNDFESSWFNPSSPGNQYKIEKITDQAGNTLAIWGGSSLDTTALDSYITAKAANGHYLISLQLHFTGNDDILFNGQGPRLKDTQMIELYDDSATGFVEPGTLTNYFTLPLGLIDGVTTLPMFFAPPNPLYGLGMDPGVISFDRPPFNGATQDYEILGIWDEDDILLYDGTSKIWTPTDGENEIPTPGEVYKIQVNDLSGSIPSPPSPYLRMSIQS